MGEDKVQSRIQYMGYLVNVLGEPERIQNLTELLDHGLIRAANVDVKIAQQQQTIIHRHKVREKRRKFCEKVFMRLGWSIYQCT